MERLLSPEGQAQGNIYRYVYTSRLHCNYDWWKDFPKYTWWKLKTPALRVTPFSLAKIYYMAISKATVLWKVIIITRIEVRSRNSTDDITTQVNNRCIYIVTWFSRCVKFVENSQHDDLPLGGRSSYLFKAQKSIRTPLEESHKICQGILDTVLCWFRNLVDHRLPTNYGQKFP